MLYHVRIKLGLKLIKLKLMKSDGGVLEPSVNTLGLTVLQFMLIIVFLSHTCAFISGTSSETYEMKALACALTVISAATLACALTPHSEGQAASFIDIDLDNGHKQASTLWGIFFEEVRMRTLLNVITTFDFSSCLDSDTVEKRSIMPWTGGC